MRGFLLAALAAAALSFSLPLVASDSKQLYIHGKDAEFDVLYHRAASNSTGAAVAGLIGAGIQASFESGKDSEKREALTPHVASDLWVKSFDTPLNVKLGKAGYELLTEATKGQPTLKITPEAYGYKVVDTSTMLMSAFVSFKARVQEGKNRQQEETFHIIHKEKHSYESLLETPEIINKELSSIVRKGARRLANKIIYKAKEK